MAAAQPKLVAPPPRLYRVGRQADPFRWRDAEVLEEDGPSEILAGNRFDAPNGEYRTLYFASAAVDALIEVLARFRPVADIEQRIDAFMEQDPDPSHEPDPRPGSVPAGFFDSRGLGSLSLTGSARFIDVDAPETHLALSQQAGQPLLERLGLGRYDRGAFTAQNRRVTRVLALELFELFGEQAAGLRYPSSLDPSAECWVLWDEHPELLLDRDVDPIGLQSKAVLQAAGILGLTT